MLRRSILLALLLAAGCQTAPARLPAPASAKPLVPAVSHHQHLMSPAIVAVWSKPPLPPVAVPEGFERLLRLRAERFGDAAALADLYTEDAILLDPQDPAWVVGRRAVAAHTASAYSRPYAISPVAQGSDGSSGQIAGYLTRGEGAAARPFAHILLSLRKGPDGAWRIAAESLVFKGPEILEPMGTDQLIAQLDEAGIGRAVVLSTAYVFGDPRRQIADEAAQVRAENDWTAAQAARFPDRLVGFCAVSPLKPYALEEIERCARQVRLSGLKLHLGNSGVDLRNPEHVAQVARVFAAANALRLPIVVHMKTRGSTYGRADAEIFLNDILPRAPDVTVQIAHMAGSGPGYPGWADEAFGVFAEAVAAKDPRVRNLVFDLTTVVTSDTTAANAALLARRIRQVGAERVLFGADLSIGGNPPPRQAWAVFRAMTPLTDDEFRVIAGNVAPYLR